MPLFAPASIRGRRFVRRLAAIAFVLVLALGFAASPTRAVGTVQLAMTVSPTIGTPSTQDLTWTITVTPVGPPASLVTIQFTTDASQGPVGCSAGCISSSGTSATWVLPIVSGATELVATTGYRGSGNVTSSVTASQGTDCTNCAQTATVLGPAGSFSVQATPTNPLPGTNVHVVISATMNQPLDAFVTSGLPAGLGPPTNASPAGSWRPGQNQMEWQIAAVASQVISYDTQVTAAPGSVLTIQNAFGSRWFPIQQQTVSVQVAASPATATPAPTAAPAPGATSTPDPTAGPGQVSSGASPDPSRPGKLTNESPLTSPGSTVGGVAISPSASGSSRASTTDSSPESNEAGSIGFPGGREDPPLGLLAVLATGAIGLLGFGAFMVYRSPDSDRSS